MHDKQTKITLKLPANLKVAVQENSITITGNNKITFEAELSVNGKKVDEKDFKTTNNNKLLLM
jgi:ribosomal protein L6P/L9E